jgi:ribosomal protein S18 acetylase RimI-like enzyme
MAESELAQVLARAFFDDPTWLWAIPDSTRRANVLRWFFPAAVRYGRLYGEVLASPQRDAAMIVLPPDRPRLNNAGLMRVGLWQMAPRAGLRGFSRFLTMRRTLEERHDADVGPRHWYVWLLGVDPASQGRGVGSALLGSLCERANRDREPVYLDTTFERNLVFYQRLGFELVYAGSFPRGGPRVWTLLRAPR